MIEYDETEQLAVTDEALRLIRLFNGDEVGAKLWYRGDMPRLNFSKSSTKPSRTA